MKIAVLEGNADIKYGGAEKSMAFFCDYLYECGFEIYLICEKQGNYSHKGYYPLKVLTTSCQPFKLQGVRGYIRSLFAIITFLKENQIDVVFTHTIHAFPILRIVKFFTRCKIIAYFKWIYNGPQIGYLNKWGINGVDNYIFINHFVENFWSRFIKRKFEIELISDGIEISNVNYSAVNTNSNKLVYVGRIYEGKGLHLLIESLKFIDPNVTLSVIGYFESEKKHEHIEYHKRIIKIIQENCLEKRVCFLGYINNIAPIIRQFHLLVVPSVLPDAQPLVLLEAMRMKTLAIASRTGGIPEILSGKLKIFLFDISPNSLAEKIKEILQMPQGEIEYFSSLMANVVSEKYSIEVTHQKLKHKLLAYEYV